MNACFQNDLRYMQCRRFIPSGQRCKTCPSGREIDLKSAQVFSQHENNST
nr:MAG TPA: hypothetical protein [Caudoviricetes sp.]